MFEGQAEIFMLMDSLLEQFYTFNCFKNHINNTQTTKPLPTNNDGVYVKHMDGLEMPLVLGVPKGWTGSSPDSLRAQSMTNHGQSFQPEGAHGNTCGQGSCENPLWP